MCTAISSHRTRSSDGGSEGAFSSIQEHNSSYIYVYAHCLRPVCCLAVLCCCCCATVAVSAAPDACAPSFNWFPTAAEIGQDVVVNNKTCTGKQVCNFPRVWTKNNQTAYMPQLGTSLSNGLMKVAFKQYGNQPPRLFFTPVSEFLESGADVSACLASKQPPTTRKLMAGAKVRTLRRFLLLLVAVMLVL